MFQRFALPVAAMLNGSCNLDNSAQYDSQILVSHCHLTNAKTTRDHANHHSVLPVVAFSVRICKYVSFWFGLFSCVQWLGKICWTIPSGERMWRYSSQYLSSYTRVASHSFNHFGQINVLYYLFFSQRNFVTQEIRQRRIFAQNATRSWRKKKNQRVSTTFITVGILMGMGSILVLLLPWCAWLNVFCVVVGCQYILIWLPWLCTIPSADTVHEEKDVQDVSSTEAISSNDAVGSPDVSGIACEPRAQKVSTYLVPSLGSLYGLSYGCRVLQNHLLLVRNV